ncbi:MAG TPA: RNA polymerase sigma factor [Chitinophagales bacterium]|nr:RNA polymerase sigma factor [Chitinophagales bacterium]
MDFELVRGCQKNNRLAQKQLYEKFYGRMMAVCLRYAANRDEAAEILNKGFLKVFTTIKNYEPERGRLDSWIYKIMLNTAIDHFRAEFRHRNNIVEMEHAFYVGDQTDVLYQISADEIIDLIQKLSPAYRTVFNMYVLEGMSHGEIAEQLGISEGTTKSNLAKARKKLQTMLTEMNKVRVEWLTG